MAETTQLRDRPAGPSQSQPEPPRERVWKRIFRGLEHIFFWAYERGTWQYDLIVIAILAFIFLTPRSWFEDRPTLQLTDLRRHQGIVEVSQKRDGRSYLVDARLVESMAPQKLEDAVREIVRSRVERPFEIQSLSPVRDRNNVLLGYTVEIQFK